MNLQDRSAQRKEIIQFGVGDIQIWLEDFVSISSVIG